MKKEDLNTEEYDDKIDDEEDDDVEVYFQRRDVDKYDLNLEARRRIEDLMDERRLAAEEMDYL
tara:strand:- start:13317 stop:13505 length:189 start_codon:yes stop_codon:yes gene_type:complete